MRDKNVKMKQNSNNNKRIKSKNAFEKYLYVLQKKAKHNDIESALMLASNF